ncbi:MAG: DUF2339 domain-containing protein [Gammaproteobacteria bacterium]|jgi:hypothetical protein
MADRLNEIEARLAAIEYRLRALEAGRPASPPEQRKLEKSRREEGLGEEHVSSAATHLGRVLLIFGGAYLLRAVTDFGFLPTQAGIPVGITYALVWLYLAYRSGGTDSRRTGAMLYGGVSVLLVMPILVEAVTRFELLSGPASAVALTVFCILALAVAILRNLRSIGWLTIAGGFGTAVLLMRLSGAALSFSMVLLLLGVASLWLTYSRDWRGLQWLGAVGANLGVVILGVLSLHEEWALNPATAYFAALALWSVYLASFVIRTHVLKHDPGLFEAVQAVLASVIAFGAAIYVARTDGMYMTVLGAAALAFAGVAYGLAFSRQTRDARGRSFYFYSTLGLVLLVGGSAVLLPPSAAGLAWAVLAAGMAWLSGRQARVSMSLQCTVLLIAAGVASGALVNTLHALVGDPVQNLPGLSFPHLVVAASAVFCLFVPVAQASDRWGRMAGLPQLIVLLLSVWIVGGLMVTVLAPVLADVPGANSDLGILATIRTAVLSAAAVTLAFSSRYRRWPEAWWLAYPVLAGVGVKLVFEDFPNGRPVTLFVALALVGGALILVAKLLPKRGRKPAKA